MFSAHAIMICFDREYIHPGVSSTEYSYATFTLWDKGLPLLFPPNPLYGGQYHIDVAA